MLSIVYLSTASFEYSDDDLATLLMNSRANNRRLELSGILLFASGRFMQLLEGPDETVREKFATISADPRHRNVKVLTEFPIETRMFPSWTMGYRPVTDQLAHVIPGYDDFFKTGQVDGSLPDTARRARWLLEWFRDNESAS